MIKDISDTRNKEWEALRRGEKGSKPWQEPGAESSPFSLLKILVLHLSTV
jgi:hypothetical protein